MPTSTLTQHVTTTTTRTTKTRMGATRAEAKRLYRPSFVGVGLGLLAGFTAMATAMTYLTATETAETGGFGGVTIGALESSNGIVVGITEASTLIGIVVLSMWAAAAASDYTTGWIRVLVQAEPRRWRLLGGKLLALTSYTIVGTAMATALGIAIAPAFAGIAEISTTAWTGGLSGTVLSAFINVTVAVTVWGVIGLTIATISRSAAVAIAGGIGYLMVFEGLLGALGTDAITYLPGTVLGAVAAGGDATLAYGPALALALGYAAAAFAIAAVVFTRRDIVS